VSDNRGTPQQRAAGATTVARALATSSQGFGEATQQSHVAVLIGAPGGSFQTSQSFFVHAAAEGRIEKLTSSI